MDKRSKLTEEERRNLLEEIRRRSEQAEMRRIEEEDQSRTEAPDPPIASPVVPTAKLHDSTENPLPVQEPTERTGQEQAAPSSAYSGETHEPEQHSGNIPRFGASSFEPPVAEETVSGVDPLPGFSALDTYEPATLSDLGSTTLESPLYTEPEAHVPFETRETDPDVVPSAAQPEPESVPLQAPRPEQSEVVTPPEPEPVQPPAPVQTAAPLTPPSRPHGEVDVPELLARAEERYEHERYDEVIAIVDQILEVNPSHNAALALREHAEQAKDLLARIAAEDAATRVHEPQVSTSFSPGAPIKQSSAEVWGSSVNVAQETFGLAEAPEVQGPMAPPKPPMTDRIYVLLVKSKKIFKPLAFVAAGVGLLVGGYYLLRMVSSTVVPQHTSLVILPATASGPDQSIALIADGLTDDFIRKLSMVSSLGVVSQASAFAPGVAGAPPHIAARLTGAGKAIQWSIVHTGDAYSVRCALIDSSGPAPEWEQKFDFPAKDFPVQRSEMLNAIIKALQVRETEEEQVNLHKPPTASEIAYTAFLQGRGMMRRIGTYGGNATVKAFERALASDSLFAEAHAALGWARIRAYESGDTSGYNPELAAGDVQHAVAMGYKNSETFRVWGALEMQRKAYAKAVERFEEAVAIAPSEAESRRRLAEAYLMLGQLDKVIPAAQRAVRDDPANIDSYVLAGLAQQISAIVNKDNKEDYQAAIDILKQGSRFARDRSAFMATYVAGPYLFLQSPDEAIPLVTDNEAGHRRDPEALYMLARVQQATGSSKQSLEVLARAKSVIQEELQKTPENPELLTWLALVQTRLGEYRDAQATAKQALAAKQISSDVLLRIARMYAIQKNDKSALEYLQKANDEKPNLQGFVDMDFFNLHSNPEFLKLLAR
jgi:tetratricopeptide (TPR) repeat protein